MPHPHAAVTDAWAERAAAIRRVWGGPGCPNCADFMLHGLPFDGDEAGLDDPEDEACG